MKNKSTDNIKLFNFKFKSQFFLSILNHCFSPIAIGMYLTMFFIIFSFKFYAMEENDYAHSNNWFTEIFKIAHYKSIDFRLKIRNPRSGSNNIAILAIDEKSVEEIGRWPWPRQKIAKMIDAILAYGAKAIAFDVIFSEEDKNSAYESLQKIKKQAVINSPQILPILEEEIAQSNADQILSNTLVRHTNQIVMGAYFDMEEFAYQDYSDQCNSYFFDQSKAGQHWLGQEKPVMALDQVLGETPETFYRLLEKKNEVIHLNVIKKWLTSPPLHFKNWSKNQTNITQEELTILMYAWIKENEESFQTVLQKKFARPILEEEAARWLKSLKEAVPEMEKMIIKRDISRQQKIYCVNWLIKNKDDFFHYIKDSWKEVQNSNERYLSLDLDKGIEQYKKSFFHNSVYPAGYWWLNIPTISSSAKHTGFFNAFLDPDGAIRRTKLIVHTGNMYMASLALKTYALINNYNIMLTVNEDSSNPGTKGPFELNLTDGDGKNMQAIPINRKGELAINYAGKRYMFPHVQISDLLKESSDLTVTQKILDKNREFKDKTWKVKKQDFIKDKIFILGATATGIYDLRVTPFEENYPGVEIHANVLDNLIRKDFLITHQDEKIYMPFILLIVGFILSVCITYGSASFSLVSTLLLLSIVYFIDEYFLFSKGLVVAICLPIFCIISVYVWLSFYRYVTEERKKKELKGTFAKYVSPSIVNEILKNPDNLKLGGRKEHMTVFFSDIRDFTTISEKLDPQSLSDLLNYYLTPMTEIIFKNKGTLDKYMGDAIMAFFGAPVSYPDHSNHACRCALETIAKLSDLQSMFRSKNLPMIDIGIGLNTGEMSVGNMGSNIVRNYTVMGDAVNLGSRLEGINKQYGTRIIISEFTKKEISQNFITRELDRVRVKGKILPVNIYELISEHKTTEQMMTVIKLFEEGLSFYHKCQFKDGIESFKKALDFKPDDVPSKIYIERCENFIKIPPKENWDGVFIMKTK